MPAIEAMTELVQLAAARAGFEAAGIAPAGSFVELEYFRDWVREGRAGEMKYLEGRSEAGELKRASLKSVAPWARSVIVCAANYNTAQPKSTDPAEAGGGPRGWISRYAWSREDYLDLVLRRLRAM